MQIQQKSFCTFLLKFKGGDVVVDPTASFKDSILIYSLSQSPYLKYEQGESTKLVVGSAGEYEALDIFVAGEKVAREESFVYTVSADDITIGIISFCNNVDSIPEDLFESADILLIGAGGGMFMMPKDAYDLAQKLAPKVCIFFGFNEQAPKDLQNTLLSVEDLKKDVTGAKLLEDKSFKITSEELERIQDTEMYYFG